MTEVSEKKIIEKVLGGDANAFEELVLKYEKTVYNLALRMVGDRDDAFDMTQEAFIKAYGSLSSFRGDSKFSVCGYTGLRRTSALIFCARKAESSRYRLP